MVLLTTNRFKKAVIHPTVLLGIVDHMNRVKDKGPHSRVVGALTGLVKEGIVHIYESFAVPFTETVEDDIWILDIDYVEEMLKMKRKVNYKENLVGWYQTGPKLRLNDIDINERFKTLNPDVVAILLDPTPKDLGFPTKAYIAVDETHDDGGPTTKTFLHLPIEIGAEEAEEVGVEHLLRGIGAPDHKSLSHAAHSSLMSLRGLHSYLLDISKYLTDVFSDNLPLKSEILEKIQAILYEVPLLVDAEVNHALVLQNNDDTAISYLSLLVRSVLALNNLINNKVKLRLAEKKLAGKDSDTKPEITIIGSTDA